MARSPESIPFERLSHVVHLAGLNLVSYTCGPLQVTLIYPFSGSSFFSDFFFLVTEINVFFCDPLSYALHF